MTEAITIYATLKAAASQMKDWSPEQVSAFFAGVSKVLLARASQPTETEKG